MTIQPQIHLNVLDELQHQMVEQDDMNRRLGVPSPNRTERLIALKDITEQVLSDIERYGMPLDGRLKGAMAEYVRWLEA